MEIEKWLTGCCLVFVFCAIQTNAAGSVESDEESGGFFFELLLKHFDEFERRIHRQMDVLQNNIVRNRKDLASLGERIGAMEESASEVGAEVSAKLLQTQEAAQSSARDVAEKFETLKTNLSTVETGWRKSLVRMREARSKLVRAPWTPNGELPAGMAKAQRTMQKAIHQVNTDQRPGLGAWPNVTFKVGEHFVNNPALRGKWMILQRRYSAGLDFNRGWDEYKHGFGDVDDQHWLGLEKLYSIVSRGWYELLIILEDFNGVSTYAHYDLFSIGSERSNYRLMSLGKYSGTAGDSLTATHRNREFSTPDRDNDRSPQNCAQMYDGGWWFDNCYRSYLNGVYREEPQKNPQVGIEWSSFRDFYYSMRKSAMLFRARL